MLRASQQEMTEPGLKPMQSCVRVHALNDCVFSLSAVDVMSPCGNVRQVFGMRLCNPEHRSECRITWAGTRVEVRARVTLPRRGRHRLNLDLAGGEGSGADKGSEED